MAKIKTIDISLLLQSLDYDPETGKLFWKIRTPDMFKHVKMTQESGCRRWNTRHAGTEAFTCVDGGYKRGAVHGVWMRAHRVAYAIHYRKWPDGEIDHINGNRTDNRIINLRDVPHSVNSKNTILSPKNTSGTSGVCFDKTSKKWKVRVVKDFKRITLGYFLTLEEAAACRKAAESSFGYHPNHGRQR